MIRLLHRTALLCFASLLLFAHASAQAPVTAVPHAGDLSVPIAVADGDYKLVPAPANQWDLHVSFGVIPGELMGNPLRQPLVLAKAAFGGTASVPYQAMLEHLAPHAASLKPEHQRAGLAIHPADTRFLRVSTFAYDKKEKEHVMGGAFASKGDFVILVYFDRACTLKGTALYSGMRAEMDVSIPAAGFHWLTMANTAQHVWRVDNVPNLDGLAFVALIN